MDSNYIYIYILYIYGKFQDFNKKNHQYTTYIDDFYYSGIRENMIAPGL